MVAGDPPAPIEDRYGAAVDVLIALHSQTLRDTLPVAPHVAHQLPRYDLDAYLIEAELLLDWYLPRVGVDVTDPIARGLSSRCGAKRSPWRSTPSRPGCCATSIRPT